MRELRHIIIVAVAILSVFGCEKSADRKLEAFWDDYDFSSCGLKDMNTATQKFRDYMQILSSADFAVAGKSIRDFVAAVERDEVAFCVYAELFMSALYPMDSPYRNASLLRAFCEEILSSDIDILPLKEEIGRVYGMSALNLKGSKAKDAEVFVDKDNAAMLHNLFGKCPLTLMFVGDPSCGSCMDMMRNISEERKVRKAVRYRKLQLLSVFCGENIREAVDNPENMWMSAHAGYKFATVYDINLSPAYYLIDNNGIVIQGVSDEIPVKLPR